MMICFCYKIEIDEKFYLSIKIFYQNNLYDNYMQCMYCFYDLNKNKIFTVGRFDRFRCINAKNLFDL